jgi:minor extracellular serine protease Vpr
VEKVRRFIVLFLWVSLVAGKVVPGRYIVELSEEPPAANAARSPKGRRAAAIQDRRTVVREQQRHASRALRGLGADVFAAVDTVANALLVSVPDGRREQLSRLAGVRRVYPVREVKLMLDHALPLHSVPEAWAILGGEDRAGAGIKIGIIDTGIDQSHLAFQDPSIPMPEGFPRVNDPSDLAFTSNKVIVARSYLNLFRGQTDVSARDSDGHGTSVAMAAAGVRHRGLFGVLSGVAPKAYLGSYNVFARGGDSRDDVILKAFDDAVADGMDVINLSLGSDLALRPNDEIFSDVFERAAALGIVVVVAAGNSGPSPFSMDSLAVSPAAIAAGASWNDRTFSGSLSLEGGPSYQAVPGGGANSRDPLTAPLFDIEQLDPTGLTCDPLPGGSLTGLIPLILRGTCLFETKLSNAALAGATAAIVYTDKLSPDPFTMGVGSARLPAAMVSNSDGLDIKRRLGDSSGLRATVDFSVRPFPVSPNRIGTFSSRGPNTDFSIKPDLLATGVSLTTAAPGNRYIVVDGTSISTPIIAGAAAVLKGARPGYSGWHYRSLLINRAAPLALDSEIFAPVQQEGGGVLDLESALTGTLAALPASLSFGIDATAGAISRQLTIANLGTAVENLSVSVEPFGSGPAPSLSANTVRIGPANMQRLTLSLATTGLPAGEYQGLVWIRGSQPASDLHVPYWYGVASGIPADLAILDPTATGSPGARLDNAFAVRITDSSGIPVKDLRPTVTATSGDGSVIQVVSIDQLSPGVFFVDVRLGPDPGDNMFHVQAGTLEQDVTIRGSRP